MDMCLVWGDIIYPDPSISGLGKGTIRSWESLFHPGFRMARDKDTLKRVITCQPDRGTAGSDLCGRYTFRYRFDDKITSPATPHRGAARKPFG